jgi:hypothetical protein
MVHHQPCCADRSPLFSAYADVLAVTCQKYRPLRATAIREPPHDTQDNDTVDERAAAVPGPHGGSRTRTIRAESRLPPAWARAALSLEPWTDSVIDLGLCF